MKTEEKQLLLKDLSARLPYGVICHTEEGDGYLHSINQTLFGNRYGIFSRLKMNYFNDSTNKQEIKPYLRPMSSITEEESRELDEHITIYDTVDWMHAHHLDYRGLIEKGLAIDCTNLDIY